ncbi:MAG: shikimate dehydrogenase [Candidatus Dadabacteria bacterium]|nr:shikimate dehydrogenase [Candidatus Dadabacteria bacterium]MDE0477466.1 shikimate dehydrogenase [Candidatus Dadabacteria bacterium]
MEIKATTRIYGIFGHPVSQSLSPAMHNAAFEHLGLDCVYLAFDVDPRNIDKAVNSIRDLGFCGVNVTIPHKQSVMAGLDEIAPEASMVGAVNTIVNEDGRLKGYNTDVSGVLRALHFELEFVPQDKNILIVGAGGASRAVIVAMCTGGTRSIAIANRTYFKAQELSEEFSPRFGDIGFSAAPLEDAARVAQMMEQTDIVINCSSAGMGDIEPLRLPLDLLDENCVVYDLVYKPAVTPLVRDSRALGLKAESGLGMLLYQGVDAFEIWTGENAPVEVMREALSVSG